MDALPCPATPGKWFRLYLKSPDSNAIKLISAACSATLSIAYVVNESLIYGAACSAVAHSPSAGGLSQVDELGEMARIWSDVISAVALTSLRAEREER